MVVDYITGGGEDNFDAKEEKHKYNNFVLNSNKISSIELRKKLFFNGCSLYVCMDNGKKYGFNGDCEELEASLKVISDEMKHNNNPSLCEFTSKK